MKYLVHLLLLLSSSLFSQKSKIMPVKKGNLWGFADENMKFVIQPQYNQAFPFEDYKIYDQISHKYQLVRLAKVYKNNKLKCIDENNSENDCTNLTPYRKEFIEPKTTVATEASIDEPVIEDQVPSIIKEKFNNVEIFYKEPMIYLVKKDKKKGLIDANGKEIIPINFDFIERHTIWENSEKKEFFFTATNLNTIKTDYFDLTGKLIFESFEPYSPIDPYNNFISIRDKNGKLRIYNLVKRNFINNKFYDKVYNSFIDEKILVERNKKEFYIDRNGKEYINNNNY